MINFREEIHSKLQHIVIRNSKKEYRNRIRDDVYPPTVTLLYDPVIKNIKERHGIN